MRATVAALSLVAFACGRVRFDAAPGAADANAADASPTCSGTLTSSFNALPGTLIPSTSLGGSVRIDQGTLLCELPATQTASAGVRTGTLSLLGRSIAVHLIKPIATSNGETAVGVHGPNANDSVHVFHDLLGFRVQRNFSTPTTGSETLATTAFSPQHAWWRLREVGDMIEIATAPDGVTWSVFAQTPVFFDVTAVYVDISVIVRSATAVADDARFDDLIDCP
jgi:hypothetical protein